MGYSCIRECSIRRKNRFARAFCIAGKCGAKAISCLTNPVCRGVFTSLPRAAFKCARRSFRDPKFKDAAYCLADIADTCGRAGIELLRDSKLADLITCNSQCTH